MPAEKNSSGGDEDVDMKDAEASKELEEDAPADKRKKLGIQSGINPLDTTLDVCPALNGKVIKGLSDGGFQYLLSGARGNIGVKSGRYAFEVTILENISTSDGASRPPAQHVKVGFSTEGSCLFMGNSEDSICFDSEGNLHHNKKKTKVFQGKVLRDQVLTVLLNLNKGAPNSNTISLFKNGQRITEPQALPDALVGKTLFPTFTFKNVALVCNFGPLAKPLPFKVMTFADVAAPDGAASKLTPPKDGKYEVRLPIGVPDEGTFDRLDHFLEKNPGFAELSDRAILEWAASSGLVRTKGKASNDKPAAAFGLPAIDDGSVRKMLDVLAPMLQRNFVMMEVAGNLTASGRQDNLARFPGPQWKKIADVAVGAPPEDFKKFVHTQLLADKQKLLDAEHAKKVAEKMKEKEAAKRKKAAEKAAAEAKAKRDAAIKKARKARERAEKKAAKIKERKEMGLDGPVSDVEDEPDEEEAPKPVEEEPEQEDAPLDPPEKAILTEEDLKIAFRSTPVKDLTTSAIASNFRKFTLPEKSEGFDAINYCWEKEGKAAEYLREYVLKMKSQQRVEDLTAGDWFKEKWSAWQKEVAGLRKKQSEFKTKGKVTKSKTEGDEENQEEDNNEDMEIDFEDLDVMTVENIDDCNGKGTPIYGKFEFEDWTLLTIRWELWCLVKAFAKDINDADIPGVTEAHLAFYYQKYYKKPFTLKNFSVTELSELVALLKDALSVNAGKVLETSLDEDTPSETFVKLTEENRRERERRVDAGDETAKLKFPRAGAAQPPGPTAATAKSAPKAEGKTPGFSPGAKAPGTTTGIAGRYAGGARTSYYGSAGPAPTAGIKRYGTVPGYGAASKVPKLGGTPGAYR